MEPTLDEVRQELAEIHEELLRIPRDAFDRRAELRAKQTELRRKSAELAEGMTIYDPKTLIAAFERLQTLREELQAQYVSPQSTDMGLGGSHTDFAAAANKALSDGVGLDEIEARLEEALAQVRASRHKN